VRFANRRLLLGGVVYLFAVEYFVAEQVAAAAWSNPAYSWAANYISDLGVTSCSPTVCSPRHAVMNTGLVTVGVVVSLGSWLLRDVLYVGRLGRSALVLMFLNGVGNVLVGSFPGSVATDADGSNLMHTIGAVLAIVGGNAGILVCGVALRRRNPLLATYSITSGVIGLVALALFANGIDLGLGIGGMERVAANPINIWIVLLGLHTLTRQRSAPPRG